LSQGEQERFDRVVAAGTVTQLIELLGLSVLADPHRVEAGLGDLLATHPREMNVLVLAAKAGLVEELVAEVRSGTHDKLRQRVAEGELRQHFSLQPSAARLALQCWREGIAGALSGTRQQQLDQQEADVRETSARISALMTADRYKAAQG
jgi:hypothetical protein